MEEEVNLGEDENVEEELKDEIGVRDCGTNRPCGRSSWTIGPGCSTVQPVASGSLEAAATWSRGCNRESGWEICGASHTNGIAGLATFIQ